MAQRKAKPTQADRVGPIVVHLVVLLCLAALLFSRYRRSMAGPAIGVWLGVYLTQRSYPRRDEARWMLFSSGLISLVLGTTALAFGLQDLAAGANPLFPWRSNWGGPVLIFSLFILLAGALVIREGFSGTLVREHAIEIFGSTCPWSQVVVKDWAERDGEFALRVAVLSPRLLGLPSVPLGEVVIPVPAAERPEVEVFLTGRAAIAG
jgi:hypothetical protein